MLFWVILGTGFVIVFCCLAVKVVEYFSEKDDLEDDPTETK